MARGRLPMRQVKKVLGFHFDEGRSARAIATHCGLARRSVALNLERFAASGLSWPEARAMDEEALEEALYQRPRRTSDWPEVDWAKVEKDLAGRGVTLMLLWEEWRETHPDGMSYPTWCCRFREWRPRRDVTMRQNRRPGERLFVDYAGMTVPLLVDGVEREAQVFVASMGVSGRLYAEATLTQKIEDWCGSYAHCFEDMDWAPPASSMAPSASSCAASPCATTMSSLKPRHERDKGARPVGAYDFRNSKTRALSDSSDMRAQGYAAVGIHPLPEC